MPKIDTKIEYSCDCYNRDYDITYGTECDTYEEAKNKVDYYRKLIHDNGEEDEHLYIEVSKDTVDSNGDIIEHKVLNVYHID